ncbi:MAG: FkbM family methyltransferase [Planctomycetaceae bacterium]|nr:FkbM family methyltransferase [Planctomycetaceae bacterium]
MLNHHPVSWVRCAWLGARLARRLSNWAEVFPRFIAGQPLPELRLRNGVVLQHAPGDAPVQLLFEIFADGAYRRHVPGPWRGTVIDIGGNIGATAIDLSYGRPDLHVHCYEPSPETRTMLSRNIAGNRLGDRVTVFDEAVGRAPGRLRLWVNGPSIAATAYSQDAPFPGCTPVEVPVIGLDDCLKRVTQGPVVLLKIDAEGAEADILEGTDPAAFARIGNVALEYHNDLCPKADERCHAVLKQAGYRCERVAAELHRGMIYGWRK